MIIKEKLVAATADDTVYSKSVSGFAMRVLAARGPKSGRSPRRRAS